MDFDEIENIIRQEFALDKPQPKFDSLTETQDYNDEAAADYYVIEEQILVPFMENKRKIITISQMVSAHYGAHG